MFRETATTGAPPARASIADSPGAVELALEVSADGARLRLEDLALGWVRLDVLELDVPRGDQIAAGADPRTLQSRRTRVRRAAIRMGQSDLDALATARGRQLAAAGIDELSLRAMDGYISLGARVRAHGHVAELTARVYPSRSGTRLRLLIDETRVYGFLPVPAPLAAHDAAVGLLATDRRWVAVRGLAELSLEPLEALLWHTLPPAGWRLPDTAAIELAEAHCRRGELSLVYAAGPARGAIASPTADLEDAQERFRAGEELLRAREIAGALRAYRAELAARGPEQPFLVERILAIASTQPEYFVDAVELARQALGRWPDFAPAHNALANIAAAQNEGLEAAHRFHILAGACSAIGDDDAATRAALAGARLLRRLSPAESTPLYELVLQHAPGEPEATEALTERYRDENRWQDLIQLIRGRIHHSTDPRAQARDHLRLADILAEAIGDARGSRAELETACRLDPESAAALESLAEAEIAIGEHVAAIAVLERVIDLYRQRGDNRSEARALLRCARLAVDAGDDEEAERRYRATLERAPNDAEALRGAAGAASRRGRHAEAAELWRLLLLSAADSPEAQAECAHELGACLVADGDTEGARPALERAARTGPPAIAAEAHALLGAIFSGDGQPEAASIEIAAAIDLLLAAADNHRPGAASPPSRLRSRAAELCLDRARLLDAIAGDDGASEAAADQYRRAFELGDERPGVRRDAARALLAHASRASDRAAERRWLDSLLGAEPGEDERRALLVARAHLSLAAGDLSAASPDVDEVCRGAADGAEAELVSEALLLKAEIARARGEPVERAEALEARAALAEGRGEAIPASLEAAEAWLEGDQAARAHAAAERALDAIRDSAGDPATDAEAREAWRLRAHRARAEASWRQRRFGELEESCREVLEGGALLEPGLRARLRYRLAVALDRSDRNADAAAGYQQVIDDEASSVELRAQALRHLAELCERLGRYDEAAERFCQLAASPGSAPRSARADAWYRAAELYRKHQGRGADAEACLEETLKLVSDHMPALDALESLRREADDYDRVAVILGRKIAATARHPGRQKSLLVRLARLQEEVLGRIDVARETYARAIEIDPGYRPALRFVAADARRRGQLPLAAETLSQLAGHLPEDGELPDDPAELEAERAAAALTLAEIAIEEPGDARITDLAAGALRRALSDRADDEALAGALEDLYRRTRNWRGLAERLAGPGPGEAMTRDLERVEILWRQLGDAPAALIAVRAARDRAPEDEPLREYEQVLEEVAAAGDTATEASIGAEVEKALAEARAARARHQGAAALAHLEPISAPAAPDDLLALRAELREELGQWDRAAQDLGALRRRAASAGERGLERRVCRKLAALTAEKLGDSLTALALYERALEIDPDDLASAEACVAIYERRGENAAQVTALERVIEIGRRTGAGPQVESSARRELAGFAIAEGKLESALEHLEEALAFDPEDQASLRALAQVHADRGDLEKQAETLRLLAGTLAERGGGRSANAGELYLELADIYYDRLGSARRGREAMLAAARAFGAGSRSRSILRLLASEAGAEADADTVVRALEMLPEAERTSSDAIALARAYQRLGRDHRAVAVLAEARSAARLSDDGAMLLFGLYRQLGRKRAMALSLERGTAEAPPAIAATRLREALILYENALGDQASAERIREQLAELAHMQQAGEAAGSPSRRPGPEELERAAEAAAAGDESAVAADLLARAVTQRAQALAGGGGGLDDATRRSLESLRSLARRDHHYEALARGLLAASAVETDRRAASSLLSEAAQVRRRHLHDNRGAADALARALALLPDDTTLCEELDATLREAGDYSQLISAYELHLGAIDGERRARPLIELARLYRDVFAEPERARAYFAEALEVAPDRAGEIEPELDALAPGAAATAAAETEESPRERPPEELIDELLELAATLEREGQLDAAIAQLERAAAAAESDARPLETLERLYSGRGDWGAVSEILGRMATAIEDRGERAAIWFRRAGLYREVLHREPEAYRCLKEAHANDPEDGEIAHELRSVAMARGEWALAAELLYREIAAAEGDVDRGALYLELALIYDEKLLDVDAAMVNYEQALAFDPEIPAAPQPLARLYELRGRHAEAAEMYELAAARARSDRDRGRWLRHAAMSAEHAGDNDTARRLYGLATVAGTPEDHERAQVALARLGGESGGATARARMLEARLEELEASGEAESALDVRRELLELAGASGDSQSALRHARALLAGDRTDVSAFVALKAQAAESGDWQQLASLLSSRAAAVGDAGEQAALYFELGRAYDRDLGDLNAAVGAYEQALAADPDHPGALEALAEICYRKHDWLRSHQLYQRLVPEKCSMPADVIAFRQGEIAEALGRESEACDAFAEAVRLFPGSKAALKALARTARRVGDLDRAIAATRALLELAPAGDVMGTTRARGELASLLAASGDLAGAIHYYELVVAEEPKAAGALAELLTLYADKGDYAGAARCLQSLIALTPEASGRADLLYRLGEIYRGQLGDDDLAADAYLKAVDLAPDHAPVLRRLLEYYFRVGDESGLLEVAADLSRAGGLTRRESGRENLARTMLLAAARNRWVLVDEIGAWFGGETIDRLALAMVETAGAGRTSWSAEDLGAAGNAVCDRLGLEAATLARLLGDRAESGDEIAAALLATLPDAGG